MRGFACFRWLFLHTQSTLKLSNQVQNNFELGPVVKEMSF